MTNAKDLSAECREAAQLYKRRVAGSFVLVEPGNLKAKLGGSDFIVTRKLDGMLAYALFAGGELALFGTGGRDLSDVPAAKALGAALAAAGVESAEVVCELHLHLESGRARVNDAVGALSDPARAANLRLTPFDIASLNGEPFRPAHYRETHAKLCELFPGEELRPVPARDAATKDEVSAIYEEWVSGEGAEGLVVHSELPIVWKVKPRHSIDAAVVGYTVNEAGLRDFLLAARREDGLFQIFAASSGGLSDDERKIWPERLAPLAVESRFVRTDSRGVAFRMLRPEVVVELSVGELVAENAAGQAKYNPLAEFDGETWRPRGRVPGVSAQAAVIERLREDKDASPENVRVSQLSDLCPFAGRPDAGADLPKSTLLKRRVFKKTSKDKVMLQKFLVWKTNKEPDQRWPAYVFHHTDYSNGRKDPLKRDLRVSSSEEQIFALFEAAIAENVKKGWEEVG